MLKDFRNPSEPIEPIGIERTNKIRIQYSRNDEKLNKYLEKLLCERVVGNVEVKEIVCGILTIRISNPSFVFGFEISQIDFHNFSTDFIVEECLYHYREAILKRYFKEEKS